MKKIFLALMATVLLTSVMGCETLKGAAKDVENTGSNIHDLLTGKTKM